MKIVSRITIAFLLLMLMIGQAMAAGSKKKVVDRGITDQDKRKAEYIYMQAQVYKAQDSIASYYDLVKYAYELDSTNTAIAFYYGYLMVLKDNSTDLEKNRGLELMKRHVDAHPEDYYETSYFSDACMSLRHNDMGLQAIERLAEINPTKTEVQMRLAAAYVRNEKFAEALKVYEKIEDFEGKSVEITAYKAALCSQLGDTIGAITEMRNLYNTAPANVNFNLIMRANI